MYLRNLATGSLEEGKEVTQKRFSKYNKSLHQPRPLPVYPSYMLKQATINYYSILLRHKPSLVIKRPRRTLTAPKEPSKNNGYDNIHDDYILRVYDTLGDNARYEIIDLMGQGTFGQVVECRSVEDGNLVAVKVIKNQPPYFMQARREVETLCMLKKDEDQRHRFLQLREFFIFKNHLCIVFELLSISLHKLLSQQPGRPNMAILDVQKISFNLLETLALLKNKRIIHTDLKPDNILLKRIDNIHDVKLIDYGSALLETDKLEYRIQTACYRSPEVILKSDFNCAIDMWSFGCFVAELFLGRPLFPSNKEPVLIHMMISLLRSYPPNYMLQTGKSTLDFFQLEGSYRLKDLPPSPHDFPISSKSLKELVMGSPSDDHSNDDREPLYDFLSHILVFDPRQRYTPQQALQHRFITAVNPVPQKKDYERLSKASLIEKTQEEAALYEPIAGQPQKTTQMTMPSKIKSPLKSILKRPDQPSKMNTVRIQETEKLHFRSSSTVSMNNMTDSSLYTTGSSTTVALSPFENKPEDKYQSFIGYQPNTMLPFNTFSQAYNTVPSYEQQQMPTAFTQQQLLYLQHYQQQQQQHQQQNK